MNEVQDTEPYFSYSETQVQFENEDIEPAILIDIYFQIKKKNEPTEDEHDHET